MSDVIHNSIKWLCRNGQITNVEIFHSHEMSETQRKYIVAELTQNMEEMHVIHHNEGQKYGFFLDISKESFDAIS